MYDSCALNHVSGCILLESAAGAGCCEAGGGSPVSPWLRRRPFKLGGWGRTLGADSRWSSAAARLPWRMLGTGWQLRAGRTVVVVRGSERVAAGLGSAAMPLPLSVLGLTSGAPAAEGAGEAGEGGGAAGGVGGRGGSRGTRRWRRRQRCGWHGCRRWAGNTRQHGAGAPTAWGGQGRDGGQLEGAEGGAARGVRGEGAVSSAAAGTAAGAWLATPGNMALARPLHGGGGGAAGAVEGRGGA